MKKYLVALAAAVSLTVMPVDFVAVADTNPATVVMTLNVHGGTDSKGGGNHGQTAPVTKDVMALVTTNEPAVIGFQEMCARQYRALRSRLSKLGYSGAFTSTQKTNGCKGSSGNAIFIKGKIQTKYVWSLPWGKNPKGTVGRQPRKLLCVKPVGQTLRACVTHLSPHAPDVLDQATKVAESIGRWSGKVILTGDFNLNPKWVARQFPSLYAVGPDIDHVLSTVPVQLGATVTVASSDHPAQFGIVG